MDHELIDQENQGALALESNPAPAVIIYTLEQVGEAISVAAVC